jgi:hypothetical protein
MKVNLATAEGQQAWLDKFNAKASKVVEVSDGGGPEDYWYPIMMDTTASTKRRDEAARELRLLGPAAIKRAQRRWIEAQDDAWWNSLPQEQKELLK